MSNRPRLLLIVSGYLLATSLLGAQDDPPRLQASLPAPASTQPPPDYFARITELYQKGDVDGAMQLCSEALVLFPNSISLYDYRALMRRDHGDLAGALDDYSQAIRLDPTDGYPLEGRGLAKKMQGDLAGARADYDAAIELMPDLVEAYERRSDLRQMTGDMPGAEADLRQAKFIRTTYERDGAGFIAILDQAEIKLGQSVRLNVLLGSGDDNKVVVPKVEGLEMDPPVITHPRPSKFQPTRLREMYLLRPTRPGNFRIVVKEVRIGGDTVLHTQTLNLQVVKAAPPTPPRLTPTPSPHPTKAPTPTPRPTPTATPTPSPHPTKAPTPTPRPTPTATPTPSPHPTKVPTPTPRPTPTATPTPSPHPTKVPTPTPRPTPTATPTPSPHPTKVPTPTPRPTATPRPTKVPTPTPRPTAKPKPTLRPTPTPTPERSSFHHRSDDTIP